MSKKLSCLIFLSISPREKVAKVEYELLRINNIKIIYEVLGWYDLCLEVEADCDEELGSIIHHISQIEGVRSISTFVISKKITGFNSKVEF